MAKAKIEKFYTRVAQEGSAGAVRGKVTVGMCNAIGAGDGDIIEWEVQNGEVIGGHVLSKSERKAHEAEVKAERKAAKTSSKPKKSAKPAKSVGKKPKVSKSVTHKTTQLKKKKKAGKRVTKVSYEEPRKAKKGKKPLLKKKR